MKFKWLSVSIIMLILTSYFLLFAVEKQQRSKILKFSHQLHIDDAGAACTDCHVNIESSTLSSDDNLPDKEVCAGCHDVDDDENCTLCHTDLDIAAAMVNPVRDFAFNHKAHLEQGMKCDACHAGIEKMAIGDGAAIPKRELCNTCHNGLEASMVCQQCHPGVTNLRPDDHTMAWARDHGTELRTSGASCSHCHSENYCQTCHESYDLISTDALPGDYYAPAAPMPEGDGGLVIQRVHDLNYRFIHQLDATGKSKDCAVCHETSTYCSECHAAGGLEPMVRPAWHGGPNWGALALAVGSGGGRHAELARRDMERCAACHDIQDADPTCLMCHTDYDGVRNTDPKTHGSDFANRFDEGSNYHTDDGAICFTCHTNTHTRGVGFCGYCHGN
ncbi:cytochrome c3 family protein [candidate division KSB1 bacterium]|nr:cytochrome c3 family protein [candidate division KSB1 bacterium]